MNNKLTEREYWESYYNKKFAKKNSIISVCSFYDKYWNLLFGVKDNSQKSLIEIGGYPGRYLAYLANKYKVSPTCLDFNSDVSQIKKVFEIMEVDSYDIIIEDFTKHSTSKKYDYVISNGFIEHFKDYNSIMDKHLDYLNDNGKILIMIPNMRGYIRFYKWLVDYGNLKIHNLRSMKLKVFKDFAERNNLKVKFLGYYGGFPINVHQKLNSFQKLIFRGHYFMFKRFFNSYLMKNPSRFFSSSIIAVFEKK